MSITKLLGLNKAGIADFEIMAKIAEAQKQNIEQVEFEKENGEKIILNLINKVTPINKSPLNGGK